MDERQTQVAPGAEDLLALAAGLAEEDVEAARAARRRMEAIVRRAGGPGAQEARVRAAAQLARLLEPAQSEAIRRQALWLLSEVGGDESVGPVAALLASPAAREDARQALERIPGERSLAALRAALAACGDDFKPALAQSLRARGVEVAGVPCVKLKPAKLTRVKRIGDRPWTMRLSTSSIHYLHLPLERACERIAALGFEAIDIWSAYTGCPHLDDALTRLGPGGLKELLEKHKLGLFAFSVYVGGYPRYAELLGGAGGGVAVRGSAGPAKAGELGQRMRELLESLKPEVELAEKHGSYLAIENHGHALLDSLDSFKAFVDLNRSPRLGIALAPYHLQAIGASAEEAVAIAGRQLFFFYAWQNAEGAGQLPGAGPADFTPWVAALAKVNYPGCLNAFMHGDLEPDAMSAALSRSRDHLKSCEVKAKEARRAGAGG